MSLSDPTKKMSKSDEDENATITLLDKPDDVRRKLRRAVTDSDASIRFDEENKPGVSNLLAILSACTDTSIDALVEELSGQGYGVLKDRTAEAINQTLAPIQAEYHRLIKDKDYLAGVLRENAGRAQAIASRTLRKVYKKLGLYQL